MAESGSLPAEGLEQTQRGPESFRSKRSAPGKDPAEASGSDSSDSALRLSPQVSQPSRSQ